MLGQHSSLRDPIDETVPFLKTAVGPVWKSWLKVTTQGGTRSGRRSQERIWSFSHPSVVGRMGEDRACGMVDRAGSQRQFWG